MCLLTGPIREFNNTGTSHCENHRGLSLTCATTNPDLKKLKTQSIRRSLDQLQRLARERADDQARRISWQRLLETRKQYIDWQEFYLWVRSILEVEPNVPDWLVETLNTLCPGFLESQKVLTREAVKTRPLHFRTPWRQEAGPIPRRFEVSVP